MIPRTALTTLFGLIGPALTADHQMLREAALRRNARHQLSSVVWREAAASLENAQAPSGWRQATGLPDSDFAAIRGIVTCLLSQAAHLLDLDSRNGDPYLAERMRLVLGAAAQSGGIAWQAMQVHLYQDRDFAAIAQRLAEELSITPELAQGIEPALACARDLLRDRLIALSDAGRLTPLNLADIAEIVRRSVRQCGPPLPAQTRRRRITRAGR